MWLMFAGENKLMYMSKITVMKHIGHSRKYYCSVDLFCWHSFNKYIDVVHVGRNMRKYVHVDDSYVRI